MLKTIYEKLFKSLHKIPRLLTALKQTIAGPMREYSEVIANDGDCLSWQSKIDDEFERIEANMKDYEEHWMQFGHIWQSNKQTKIIEFESLETATAQRYDQQLQDLIALSNQVAVREVSKKVNFTLIDATKLRKTILIEIEEWKRMYLISLKTKTQSKITELFTYTIENGQKLSIAPKTVEELQKCCAIYEQLKNEIDDRKRILYSLNDQFEVLLKYGVPIDDELNEMKENMLTQWEDYLEKLNVADEELNNAKDSFKLTLESTRKTPDFFQ